MPCASHHGLAGFVVHLMVGCVLAVCFFWPAPLSRARPCVKQVLRNGDGDRVLGILLEQAHQKLVPGRNEVAVTHVSMNGV